MSYTSPLQKFYQPVTTQPAGDLELPWEFSSLEQEYRALRQKAVLLDFSYAGRILISGEQAMEYMQKMCTRDLEYLMPDRALFSLVLDQEARPLDVVTVYNHGESYWVETSPWGRQAVWQLLTENCVDGMEVRDLSEQYAVLGLEGPYAWQVLSRVADFDVSILAYKGFLPASWQGEPFWVARMGYTAEYGYRIYAAPGLAEQLWTVLAGEAEPAGYHALEVAMLEVRQPLLHRELGEDGNVLRCGLNWLVDLNKEDFWGKEALMAQRQNGYDYLTVGFCAGPAVQLAAGCVVAAAEGTEIGQVVTCLFSPGLGKQLGLARLQHEWTASGLDLLVRDVHGEWQPVRTLSAPYITPKSWNVAMV
ncbi:MAG: aminomethyltransferase family protein [Desulfurispora sp.]|uniref:aminomethyltransferase family protein n=1 Tax=Desulfurispora sp. TaxID=3014275 RepID=UPI004049E221